MRLYILHILLLIILLLNPVLAISQNNSGFQYNIRLQNSDGEVINNKLVVVKISLISDENESDIYYEENHKATTDINGRIRLTIGHGEATYGNFTNVEWDHNSTFIKTELDTENNGDFIHISTKKLLSVPFVMYAHKAFEAPEAKNRNAADETPQDLNLTNNILTITGIDTPTQIDLGQIDIPELTNNVDNKIDTTEFSEICKSLHINMCSYGDRDLDKKVRFTDVYFRPKVESLLSEKVDISNTYLINNFDNLTATYANISDLYIRSEIDAAFAPKRNLSDTYLKNEIKIKLNEKIFNSESYKISEFDNLISQKADINNTYSINDFNAEIDKKSNKSEFNDFKNQKNQPDGLSGLNISSKIESVFLSSNVLTDSEITTSVNNLKESVVDEGNSLNKLYNLINSKENNISKLTAFNKNFGTGNSDASHGDHSHTLGSLGLDKLENKSSADVRGEITESNVPSLSTSKITSGKFDKARLPDFSDTTTFLVSTSLIPTSKTIKKYVENSTKSEVAIVSESILQGSHSSHENMNITFQDWGDTGIRFKPSKSGKLTKMFVDIQNGEWSNSPGNILTFYIALVLPNSNNMLSNTFELKNDNKAGYNISGTLTTSATSYSHSAGWDVNEFYVSAGNEYIIFWKYNSSTNLPIVCSSTTANKTFLSVNNQKSLGIMVQRSNSSSNQWNIYDPATVHIASARLWIE